MEAQGLSRGQGSYPYARTSFLRPADYIFLFLLLCWWAAPLLPAAGEVITDAPFKKLAWPTTAPPISQLAGAACGSWTYCPGRVAGRPDSG